MPPVSCVWDVNGYVYSVGGLARGGIVEPDLTSPYNDYLGHVFWDMDTWIMPALLLFHPNMAKLCIEARTRVANVARENAAMSGLKGMRFPWEQAYLGLLGFLKWHAFLNFIFSLLHFWVFEQC